MRKRTCGSDSSKAGYSLVEMAITGSIMGLVALTAAPNLLTQTPGYLLDRATSTVVSELRAARMQAVSQSVEVEVAYEAGTSTFVRKADLNGNSTIEPNERTENVIEDIDGLSVTMPLSPGAFSSVGLFESSTSPYMVHVVSPTAGDKYIYVFPSGHIQVTDTAI